jgi:hypothetical protein
MLKIKNKILIILVGFKRIKLKIKKIKKKLKIKII